MNKEETKFPDNLNRSANSCCNGHHGVTPNEMTRRKFVSMTGTSALGTVALSGLSWAALRSL
jgi:hypothetical protein